MTADGQHGGLENPPWCCVCIFPSQSSPDRRGIFQVWAGPYVRDRPPFVGAAKVLGATTPSSRMTKLRERRTVSLQAARRCMQPSTTFHSSSCRIPVKLPCGYTKFTKGKHRASTPWSTPAGRGERRQSAGICAEWSLFAFK